MRPLYGFWLSVLTAALWGMLPVAMLLLLGKVDAITVTWVRFLFSAICVGVFLHRKRQLPNLGMLDGSKRVMLAVAVLALLGNFILYLIGLDYLNPEATAVLIQLAPILLLLGSVYFNDEHLTVTEWAGAFVLFVGLLLFFNQRLWHLFGALGNDTLGVLIMLAAAVSWSIYGLMQKRLLQAMGSIQLTLMLYGAGTLALAVFASPLVLLEMSAVQTAALLFGCLNMVFGYGAFTEALRVWQAAKVSAVIALAPVFTIIAMKVAVWGWPDVFVSSELNVLAYVGALVVVAGSMLAALGKQRQSH